MSSEIVRKCVQQIINGIVVITILAMVMGVLFGLYMLDHYRWGGCK